MPNYQKLYHMMFAAAADAVELLEQQKYFEARVLLIRAQLRAEALVIADADADAAPPEGGPEALQTP